MRLAIHVDPQSRVKSIQRNLSVNLAVAITLLWLLAAVVSGVVVSQELNEVLDSSLRTTGRQLVLLIDDDSLALDPAQTWSGESGASGASADASADAALESVRVEQEFDELDRLLAFVIRDRDRSILAMRGSLPQQLLDADLPAGFSTFHGYRVYVQSASGNRSIMTADPLGHRRETAFEGIMVMLAALALLVPLTLLSGGWVIRRGLRDVHAVQVQIESRSGNDLRMLETGEMPRELQPIAESVNRLLARLSQTLEAERHFTTNSAHELRTPIASAMSQTQRQIASLPEGAERERARGIEKTLQGLARMSEKLMQLARAESGTMVTDQKSNAFVVIRHVVDEFSSRQEYARPVQLVCVAERRFDTRLDPDGMAILLRNLIDNALKHGLAATPVEVVVDSTRNEVKVLNEGPIVAAAELRSLKERFDRGTAAGKSHNASGFGLGLAIADTIASQAGISLTLLSPAHGRKDGFQVTLSSSGP